MFMRQAWSYRPASVAWGHRFFDEMRWTFYPDVQLLKDFINMEERRLIEREQALANGQQDPGRLPYEQSYQQYTGPDHPNTYNVFCRSEVGSFVMRMDPEGLNPVIHRISSRSDLLHYPPLPAVQLIVSPTIVVYIRTAVLVTIDQEIPVEPSDDILVSTRLRVCVQWCSD